MSSVSSGVVVPLGKRSFHARGDKGSRLDIVLTGPHGERQGFVRISEASVSGGAVTLMAYRVR